MHTKPPVGDCGTLLYPRTRFSVMGPGTAPGALDPPLTTSVGSRAGRTGIRRAWARVGLYITGEQEKQGEERR